MAGLTRGSSARTGSSSLQQACPKGGQMHFALCCFLLRHSAGSSWVSPPPPPPPSPSPLLLHHNQPARREMFALVMNYSSRTEHCLFHVCQPLYQSSAPVRETYLDLPLRRPAGGQKSPLLLPSCTNLSTYFTQDHCLADFCHFQHNYIKYHSYDINFRFQPSLEVRHFHTTSRKPS